MWKTNSCQVSQPFPSYAYPPVSTTLMKVTHNMKVAQMDRNPVQTNWPNETVVFGEPQTTDRTTTQYNWKPNPIVWAPTSSNIPRTWAYQCPSSTC
jgi:hypothetical protein